LNDFQHVGHVLRLFSGEAAVSYVSVATVRAVGSLIACAPKSSGATFVRACLRDLFAKAGSASEQIVRIVDKVLMSLFIRARNDELIML
jgi:hypothetical protein